MCRSSIMSTKTPAPFRNILIIINVLLANKVAPSEWTFYKENPSKNDVEVLMGFTSKHVGPNSGEKTADYHENKVNRDRT